MSEKYQPLKRFLAGQSEKMNALTLSFKEIEEILCTSLPISAFKHNAWWANQSDTSKRPQARSWIDAGFIVESKNQNEKWVRFERVMESS